MWAEAKATTADGQDASLLVPDVIPLFPLPATVLLPGELLPLHVFEPRYRAMTRDALAAQRVIGVVAIAPGHEDAQAGAPPLAAVGCLGFVVRHVELEDGRYLLWLVGLEPFRIASELAADTPYRQARVEVLAGADDGPGSARLAPLRGELRRLLPELAGGDGVAQVAVARPADDATDTQLQALACEALELPAARRQELLETPSLADRYVAVLDAVYARLEGREALTEVERERLN